MSSIMRRRGGFISPIWSSPVLRGVDVTITSYRTGAFSSESSPLLLRSGFVQFYLSMGPRMPRSIAPFLHFGGSCSSGSVVCKPTILYSLPRQNAA